MTTTLSYIQFGHTFVLSYLFDNFYVGISFCFLDCPSVVFLSIHNTELVRGRRITSTALCPLDRVRYRESEVQNLLELLVPDRRVRLIQTNKSSSTTRPKRCMSSSSRKLPRQTSR